MIVVVVGMVIDVKASTVIVFVVKVVVVEDEVRVVEIVTVAEKNAVVVTKVGISTKPVASV